MIIGIIIYYEKNMIKKYFLFYRVYLYSIVPLFLVLEITCSYIDDIGSEKLIERFSAVIRIQISHLSLRESIQKFFFYKVVKEHV